jgi:hypothetical protein
MKSYTFGAVFFSTLLCFAGGCKSVPEIPVIEFRLPPSAPGAAPTMNRNVFIILSTPELRVDLNWLDLEGFFPPGAERILGKSVPDVLPDNRTRFPSTDVSVSPNRAIVLFHDGQRRERWIQHSLMLRRSGSEQPTTVFATVRMFDVTWAPNSEQFAVTNYTGDNSSEVTVFGVDGRKTRIDLRLLIEESFPSEMWSALLFVKAYRWTSHSQLVLRALGRSALQPVAILGCEAVVDLTSTGEAQISFCRGYIKRAPEQNG